MAKSRRAARELYPIWAGDILHVIADIRRDMEAGFKALNDRLDQRYELDAIDDHAPRDWPQDCPHTSFYCVSDPGMRPIYMCIECGEEFDHD